MVSRAYKNLIVDLAWDAWQDSRQKLEGEPVAVVDRVGIMQRLSPYTNLPEGTKLYTHPASAEVERLQARVAELESDEQEMAGDNNV